MKSKIFSIYDSKTEAYGHPSFLKNEGQALRGFSDAIEDKSTIMGKHPADFTLFRIGTFDENTGKVEAETPVSLGNGLDFEYTDG